MQNKENIQNYFNKKYYNIDNNYQSILSQIMEDKNKNTGKFFDFLKIIATTIITLLGTTGIVFAGVQIYNEYIKRQEEIASNELYLTEEGLFSYDFAENMTYDESSNLYYKIIDNIEEYNKYKNIVSELPEMLEEDFTNNYLIIVGNWGARNPHETDLMISKVDADEETTYIILKQKENPNYDKSVITLYAVVDNQSLRKNIKLITENTEKMQENYLNLQQLQNNYSIEDALRDDCLVVKDYQIISENKNSLDELIENSKNNLESFIRIYSCNNNKAKIIDLQYKDNIFMAQVRTLGNSDVYEFSFKYLTKKALSQNNTYEYGYNNVDRSKDAGYLLKICYD